LALAATVTLTCVGGACSLDWTVRPDPGDAAPEATAGDTGVTDSSVADGQADSAEDAPLADAGPCETLAAEVTRTRAKAKDCQLGLGGQCTTTVQDECDCAVVVRYAGVPASTDYANAIAALVSTCGKPASCGACPLLGIPASWACLQPSGIARCVP
jgi:hypothetical protein